VFDARVDPDSQDRTLYHTYSFAVVVGDEISIRSTALDGVAVVRLEGFWDMPAAIKDGRRQPGCIRPSAKGNPVLVRTLGFERDGDDANLFLTAPVFFSSGDPRRVPLTAAPCPYY